MITKTRVSYTGLIPYNTMTESENNRNKDILLSQKTLNEFSDEEIRVLQKKLEELHIHEISSQIDFLEPVVKDNLSKKILFKNNTNKDSLLSLKDDLQRKNYQLHAEKLLIVSCWLKQEQQADLIEMRQKWYTDRSLNFCTHLLVGLKTHKYLIFDLFFFSTIQKIKHRFQPMKKDRLPKIKSSD